MLEKKKKKNWQNIFFLGQNWTLMTTKEAVDQRTSHRTPTPSLPPSSGKNNPTTLAAT